MKRFLLIPSCALVALSVLTSCQKEDKSALELAQELTAELQKVTDYSTAETVAPRVQALNQRLQNASVRTVTLNSSALLRSDQGDGGAAFADAMVKLAREVGRVRSSVPVTEADGEVDADMLVMATGVATGVEPTASASARKAAGEKFMKHDADKSHENPPEFDECYGSAKLKEALAYTVDPASAPIMKFDGADDVPAIPEPAAAPAEADEADEPAVEETEPAAEESAAADSDDTAAEEPAEAEESAEDDISVSVDDEEPAADDEEPAADEDDAGLDIDISVDDL